MNAINRAILEQFGPEISAGQHREYPSLRRLWLENEIAKAEQAALVQSCWEVANGADRNWLEN